MGDPGSARLDAASVEVGGAVAVVAEGWVDEVEEVVAAAEETGREWVAAEMGLGARASEETVERLAGIVGQEKLVEIVVGKVEVVEQQAVES